MARRTNSTRPQLYEGETLLWTGSPCEEKDYGKIDWILLPLSALLLAISALFGAVVVFSIVHGGFAVIHLVQLLLLACVGGLAAYSYFFRFEAKRRIKAELVYGVTSRGRVLIRDSFSHRFFIYEGDELSEARITEVDRCGIGTIYLRPRHEGSLLDNTGLEFLAMKDGSGVALYDVANCEKLLRLIQSRSR